MKLEAKLNQLLNLKPKSAPQVIDQRRQVGFANLREALQHLGIIPAAFDGSRTVIIRSLDDEYFGTTFNLPMVIGNYTIEDLQMNGGVYELCLVESTITTRSPGQSR